MQVLNSIFICIYWCSHSYTTAILFQAWEPC